MELPDIEVQKDTLDRVLYCEHSHAVTGSYFTMQGKCTLCSIYPCEKIKEKDRFILENSPLMKICGGKLIPRRKKMFLFLHTDGSLTEAYKDFDVKDPDWNQMQSVKEVLYVSKVYEPQLKLVPRTQAERSDIANTQAQPKKKQTNKKGK